ncbi:hypothetical protein ACFB49_46310 [Sphingomonas sp. DBB INV C78]
MAMPIGAEARRIIAALEEGQPARRQAAGWRVGAIDAPDDVIEQLSRADLVKQTPTRLALTPAGRGFTARATRPEAANRLLTEKALPGDGAARNRRPARSVTVNGAESPLGWLMARGLVSRRQFDAGERLRADWEMAGLSPRVTMRWDAAPVARGARGADAPLDPTLAQIAARRRFDAAIAAAGPGLSDIGWRVVCAGEGLEAAERALAWPKRAGKLVLLLALDRVADFYGIG